MSATTSPSDTDPGTPSRRHGRRRRRRSHGQAARGGYTTRDAFDEANRLRPARVPTRRCKIVVGDVRRVSPSGLFLGGAPRVLVLAALLPAGLVGTALMDRRASR